MIVSSVTEELLYTALRGFLLPIVDGEVFQTQDNGVSMPNGQFTTMTTLRVDGLSTDKKVWADTGSSATSSMKHTRSSQWAVQIDVYGDLAMDRATSAAALVRTDYACDLFTAFGIDMAPLYAGEPHQTTMINAEQQYESRWTFDVMFQFNPIYTVPEQYADQLQINLAEIDATFPPED